MQDSHYTISIMNQETFTTVVDWAAQEGWNPGLYDGDCYYNIDQNGFLVGCLDGEPIASISVVRYDDSFGFLGFYIVRPEYRGRGYGLRIWQAGMEYLRGCNVALDGVVDQQPNYKKSGFKLAYRNIRYQGNGGGEAALSESVIPLSSLPISALLNYDRPFFPASRDGFIRDWVAQPESHALGILQDDQLAGYGVMRRCRDGYKIGPLYADTPAQAEGLFQALRGRAPETEPVFLDTPEVNPDAVALAERYGMTVSFETARMYTREAPELPVQKVFGVTSFEVG